MRPRIGAFASGGLLIAGKQLRFLAAAMALARRGTSQASPIASNQAAAPSWPTGAEPITLRPAAAKFAQRRGVEGVDGRDRRAIERAIEFAPFAGRNRRSRREAKQIQHPADLHRIDREHLRLPAMTVGAFGVARPRGACTGPRSASRRAKFSIAPARTSLASAWVGTPNPGTSMPMMRTPSISFGRRRSGTPEAVGTQRLMTTIAS